jgi:hypothetical protein
MRRTPERPRAAAASVVMPAVMTPPVARARPPGGNRARRARTVKVKPRTRRKSSRASRRVRVQRQTVVQLGADEAQVEQEDAG